MDPATAITVGTALASTLLRGLASLPERHVAPWKYYELGQRCARCRAGQFLLPPKARGCREKWWTGTRLYASDSGLVASAQRYKDRYRIERFAGWLLEGEKPPGMYHLWGFDSDLDDDPDDPHWGFFELGRMMWMARWDAACRPIIGSTWDEFVKKTGWQQWSVLAGSDTPMAGQAAAKIKQIRSQNSQAIGKLKAAFLRLTPRRVRTREQAERLLRDLAQETQARAQAAAENLLWYGPPAGWIIRRAVEGYKRHGARAVLRYVAARPDLTAALLARHAPDATSDPVLISAFGGSMLAGSGRKN